MAVRHGYGKIAGTDALVFAYDTGDTRNSYRGEPTVNLLYSPGAYNLIDGANDIYGRCTKTDLGNGKYRFVNNGVNSSTIRVYTNQGDLIDGATYACSVYFENLVGALSIDWCDTGITGINYSTNPSGRLAGTGTRASYASPYYFLDINLNVGGAVTLFNPQVEQKSHATPFVNGTRSATQGLLDLTGNNSIDLSNVSFDSNAQIAFDGSNDHVDLSSATGLLNLGSTFSIESIFKLDNTSQEFGTVFSSLDVATGTQTKGVGFYWKKTAEYGMSANTMRLQLGLSAWSWHIFASNGISISDTNYHHIAVTLTGGNTNYPTIIFYIDGVAQAATKWTAGSIGPINNSSNANSLRLGSIYTASDPSYNNFYSAESLNVVKIYNRVLTADEVRNNYRHYKNRFNIS